MKKHSLEAQRSSKVENAHPARRLTKESLRAAEDARRALEDRIVQLEDKLRSNRDDLKDPTISTEAESWQHRLSDNSRRSSVVEQQQPSYVLFLTVFVCCVSPILFGSSVAFTSPSLSTMQRERSASGSYPPSHLGAFASTLEGSSYAAILNVGCVLGAFSGSFLSDRFGRRTTLIVSAFPHLCAWTASSYASDWMLLCHLRALIGWGVGVGSAVTPVYISEVSTVGLRGCLGAANQLAITIGILIANIMGSYVFVEEGAFCQWRHLCLFNGVLSLVLISLVFAPESPKWLASRGKAEAARDSLRKLRSNDPSREMYELLLLVNSSGNHKFLQVSVFASLRKCRRSLTIGIGLCIFQQFSGINAVLMYLAAICAKAGMDHNAAVFSMVAQVVLTGLACILVERAGRRLLLLFATATMTVACSVLAYYYFATGSYVMWAPSWLPMLGICMYIVGFSLGMGPIPWVILGEIFPTEVRSSASSLATATNWTCSFLVTLFFVPMVDLLNKLRPDGEFGQAIVFAIFGVVCSFSFVFVFGLVPETKGKAVTDILMLLGCSCKIDADDTKKSYGSFV